MDQERDWPSIKREEERRQAIVRFQASINDLFQKVWSDPRHSDILFEAVEKLKSDGVGFVGFVTVFQPPHQIEQIEDVQFYPHLTMKDVEFLMEIDVCPPDDNNKSMH